MLCDASLLMSANVLGMAIPVSSLRERSKAKRREAIQRAAMRLFAQRGYDGATIAEIAEEAEVAPRTVSMYFPSKLDIAMSTSSEIAARLTATFQANPELPFTEVVDRWLVGEADSMDTELAGLTSAMFDANPALRAVSTTHLAEVASIGGPALVAEVGLPPDDAMVKIATAAASAAINEYFATALPTGASKDVHQSFIRYLRAIIAAARPA
jgi:AcrR family transcriptional regulator